jgi:hypothetical protein
MMRWGWRVKTRQAVKNISSSNDDAQTSPAYRPVVGVPSVWKTHGGSVPAGQGRRSTNDTACRLSVFGRRFTSVGGQQGNGLGLGDDERPAPRSVPAVCWTMAVMLLRRRCREGIARRKKDQFG